MSLGAQKDWPRIRAHRVSPTQWALYMAGREKRGDPLRDVESAGLASELRRRQVCFMIVADPHKGPWPGMPPMFEPPRDFLVVTHSYCRPEDRRKGYATKLHEAAARLACSKGYKGTTSHTADRSEEATAVWDSLQRHGGADEVELTDDELAEGSYYSAFPWDTLTCRRKK